MCPGGGAEWAGTGSHWGGARGACGWGCRGDSTKQKARHLAWVQQGLKTETERGCRREVWEGSWRQAEGPVLVGDTQRRQTIPPSLPRADKKEATSGGVSNGAIVGAGISALSFCLCLILVM